MLHIVHTTPLPQEGMLPRQRHCTREMCEPIFVCFLGGGGGEFLN